MAEEDDPVGAWLVEVGLEDFAPTFKREGFEGAACVKELQGLTAQQLVALAASLEPTAAARSTDRGTGPSAASAASSLSAAAAVAPADITPAAAAAGRSSARKERRNRRERGGGCCAAPRDSKVRRNAREMGEVALPKRAPDHSAMPVSEPSLDGSGREHRRSGAQQAGKRLDSGEIGSVLQAPGVGVSTLRVSQRTSSPASSSASLPAAQSEQRAVAAEQRAVAAEQRAAVLERKLALSEQICATLTEQVGLLPALIEKRVVAQQSESVALTAVHGKNSTRDAALVCESSSVTSSGAVACDESAAQATQSRIPLDKMQPAKLVEESSHTVGAASPTTPLPWDHNNSHSERDLSSDDGEDTDDYSDDVLSNGMSDDEDPSTWSFFNDGRSRRALEPEQEPEPQPEPQSQPQNQELTSVVRVEDMRVPAAAVEHTQLAPQSEARRKIRAEADREAATTVTAAATAAQKQDEEDRRRVAEEMTAVAAAQKQAEEDRLRAATEMAAVAAAQKQVEEDRLRAAEMAAVVAAQKQAEEDRRRVAEEMTAVAAAQKQVEEDRLRAAAEMAAVAAEQKQVEEDRLRAAEMAAVAAAQKQAEEDRLRAAEEMTAVAAAQKQVEEDRRRAAAEMAAVAAEQKQVEEDRLRAAEMAAVVAEQQQDRLRAAVAAAEQKQAEEDRLRAVEELTAVAAAQKQVEEDRLRAAAEIAAQQYHMTEQAEEQRIADAAVKEGLIAAAVVEKERIAALQAERKNIAAEKRALAQQAQSALMRQKQMLAERAVQEAEAAKTERAELQRQQQQLQQIQNEQEQQQQKLQQRVHLSSPNQETFSAPSFDVSAQPQSSNGSPGLHGQEYKQANMWESQCAALVSFYAAAGAPKQRHEVESLLRKRTRQVTSSLNQNGGQPLNAPEWKRLADGLAVKYGKLPPLLFEDVDVDGDGVVTLAEAPCFKN
eukprot:COSAG02_NODE_394_length_23152_cov_13.232204_18_plen_944_part_00